MGDRGKRGPRVVAPDPDDAVGRGVPDVADVAHLRVQPGGRVLVASDLHLAARPGPASTTASEALAAALEATSCPGVVVLAGDCFELLVGAQLDPGPALDAHPALTDALARWAARPDRSVVVLPGNHDGALAWHRPAAATVRRRLGATVALVADLDLVVGAGTRRVRVEHGHQVDPTNAFVDPRDPAETPLGHHVAQELLPLLGGTAPDGWAGGLELVADPLDVPALLGSRLAYRRLAPALAVAAVPALAALLLALAARAGAPTGPAAVVALALAAAVGVAVVGGAAFWGGLARRCLREVQLDVSGLVEPGNAAARGAPPPSPRPASTPTSPATPTCPSWASSTGSSTPTAGAGAPSCTRAPAAGPCPVPSPAPTWCRGSSSTPAPTSSPASSSASRRWAGSPARSAGAPARPRPPRPPRRWSRPSARRLGPSVPPPSSPEADRLCQAQPVRR